MYDVYKIPNWFFETHLVESNVLEKDRLGYVSGILLPDSF